MNNLFLAKCQSDNMKTLFLEMKDIFKNFNEPQNSPQKLTIMYDDVYERAFLDIDSGINTVGSYAKIINPVLTFSEVLYLCFTHLRRHDMKENFLKLYSLIESDNAYYEKKDIHNKFTEITAYTKEWDISETTSASESESRGLYIKDILKTPLLEPFILYDFIYLCEKNEIKSYDYRLLTQNSFEWGSNKIIDFNIKKGLHLRSLQKVVNVTYSDFVYIILNKNRERYIDDKANYIKFYKNAYNAICEVIEDKSFDDYALYYYIKAKILFLGLELGIEDESSIEIIRTNINTALELEKSSATGLRKKTQYLSQLSELNIYEMKLIIEKNDIKVKEIEENSVKKFSMFSAFVAFAVGLISKFINSGATPFHETVGYFFVLFGISAAIFSIFDLLILGPLSSIIKQEKKQSQENKQSQEKKSNHNLSGKFWIKLVLELFIIIVFLVLGCLIGFQKI